MDECSLLSIKLYTGRTFKSNSGVSNFQPFKIRLTISTVAFVPRIAILVLREINFTPERDVTWLQVERDKLTFEQIIFFQS